MKKIILFFTILLSLSITGQEYIPGQLQLGATPVANNGDFLSALGTHNGNANIVSKTQITVQQLLDVINGGGSVNWQQVMDEGNQTTTDVILRKSGSDSEQKITFDTDNQDIIIGQTTVGGRAPQTEFYINKNGTNILSFDNYNTFRFERNGSVLTPLEIRSQFTPYTIRLSAPSGLTQNVFQTFQNKSGVVATTEDFDDWLRDSGTSSGGNLKVEIGDYNNNNNGTSLNIDDSNSVFWFKSGTVTGSEIRFPVIQLGNINSNGQPDGNAGLITQPSGGFTANRVIRVQDKDGEVAYLSDIPTIQAGTNITIDNTDPLNPIISSSGGGGGGTNLGYTASPTQGTVTSDTGTNAVIPIVTNTNAGLQKPDFYEEGTFVPNLVDIAGGATYTFSVQEAKYIRIGNEVTFNVYITNINSTGTTSGSLNIEGLPFSNTILSSLNVSSFIGSTLLTSQLDRLESALIGNDIVFKEIDTSPALSVSFTNGNILVSGTYITNVYTP